MGQCLFFPYFEKDKQTAAKIRSRDSKRFLCEGSPRSFFNIQNVTPGNDLFVAEGEADSLSFLELGHESVSVPNGAPAAVKNGKIDPREDGKFSFVWAAKAVLDSAKRIIIATDNDPPGDALAEELARRIGKARCWKLTWPEGIKDANDALRAGVLQKCIDENIQPWPVSGLYDADHFKEQARDLLLHGQRRGVSTGWRAVDDIFTIQPGQLVLVTGRPGAGKSTWLNALLVNLALRQGWKCAFHSTETPPPVHLGLLASLYVGKPFFYHSGKMTEAEFDRASAWVQNHFCFLHSEGPTSYQDVIERFEIAVMRYGTRVVVCDPASYLARPDTQDVDWAGQMLDAFGNFAVQRDCAVFVVAHPRKMPLQPDGSYGVPTGWEVSGSANYFNKPSVGLTVHRQPDSIMSEVHCWKARFGWVAREGKSELYYDRLTGRFGDDPFGADTPRVPTQAPDWWNE